jgi:lipooligosaccharide transport system permease protein
MTAPSMAARPSPVPVFLYRWTLYVRTWRGTVFSSFLLPVLFLVGMGVSVGSYVDANGTLGVSYVDYIAPALLASTVFQIGVSEASWPVLGGFQWVRTYYAMGATPLRPRDMVGGELLFIGLRAAASAVGFGIVMALFGAVHGWTGLALLPVAVLLAVASAAPVLAYSATITTDNMFSILFRFGVIPMTLLAGVFFPVEQLPSAVRWLAYLTPLWHGVELSRAASMDTATAAPWMLHVGYLAAWLVVGYLLAARRFTRKLMD